MVLEGHCLFSNFKGLKARYFREGSLSLEYRQYGKCHNEQHTDIGIVIGLKFCVAVILYYGVFEYKEHFNPRVVGTSDSP